MAKQLLYFADPMCSWCWGFSPVVEALQAETKGMLPIHVIMGGLRTGTTAPMTESMKATIREHWEHVEALSGQPFDFRFFDRDGFVYDTEPACRAVVAVRRLDPAAALPFLRCVQYRFYGKNGDVTDPAILADTAGAAGIDRAAFDDMFSDSTTLEVTAWDFDTARRLGVTGFPALIAQDDGAAAYLTQGYQPWADLAPIVNGWLAGEVAIR